MNTSNQDPIILTTNSSQYSVAPGETLEIPVLLANQGSIQNQLRISVEGIPMVWVSTEHQVVLLQPGEQRQIILKIQPPALPNVQVGRYMLKLLATSVIDSSQTAQKQATLMVAGFEAKGRIGVLLGGVQYTVIPGEKLAIPVVMINQGLGGDAFRLALEGLPESWTSIPDPVSRLQPGEMKEAVLTIEPPRSPIARASRYTFNILVSSQEAPDQNVKIDCTLTVAAFMEFKSSLEAAQPDQNLPARVLVQNNANIPASFQVTFNSPEDSVTFVPKEPQQVNVPSGESAKVEYTAQPSRRPWFGGEKSLLYSVKVQESGGQTQTLDGALMSKALLPVWAAVAGGVVLLLLILILLGRVLFPGFLRPSGATATPTITSTATVPVPTATQSQIDQRPLLIEQEWYLVAFNNTRSSPGVQEAYTLFNPDGTLIGYTGCKDLNAQYQTNYNQISITNLSLGSGVCPDATLQQQEATMVAILRSARSYLVADTALQIGGDAGFLNYSLTPLNRSEEIQPPQAVIKTVSQSQVGQAVVFDGSASTGQVPLVSWRWEFGDNTTASGIVVQHTFITAGTFTVRLTVTDQRGQTGSSTAQIQIMQLPTATLTPTVPPPTATAPQPTQPPEQPTYTPGPTAQAPTSTPEPPPAPVPPQANISGPSKGFIGEPVKFDASASQQGSSAIVSYSWSMGNGETLPASPASSTSYIYKAAGFYEVTVTVTDGNGLSSQATTNIEIDSRLDTDVWTLSELDKEPLLPNTAITLQFKQGEVVGFAGCNEYSGEYTAVDNGDGTYTISIDKLETTRRACAKDIMEQEEHYLIILEAATKATVKENELILNSPSDELDFYLIEAP
jgi:heat shock protein HslJ